MENLKIQSLRLSDSKRAMALAQRMGRQAEETYLYENFQLLEEGKRDILLAQMDGEDVGYCIINWLPKYQFFKMEGIPEIQGLIVLPELRSKGIGSAMIEYCEKLAWDNRYNRMGIAVGLHKSFGPAQRLYIRHGYVPDGYGITYDRMTVSEGEFKPVDDHLCLMLIKDLRLS